MAKRTYKRDKLGRFAKTGSSGGTKVAGRPPHSIRKNGNSRSNRAIKASKPTVVI